MAMTFTREQNFYVQFYWLFFISFHGRLWNFEKYLRACM